MTKKKKKLKPSKTIKLNTLGKGETDIRLLMKRRWLQILVHSCIYYRHHTSLINDHQWDDWSKELIKLVRKYPKIAMSMPESNYLLEFDGSTGFDLPLTLPWINNKAMQLISYERRKRSVVKLHFK